MVGLVAEDLLKKYSNGLANVRDLEDMGCVVLYGVDATKMSQHFFLSTHRFDRIVYNFPHVGFLFPEANGCQIKYVHIYIRLLFLPPSFHEYSILCLIDFLDYILVIIDYSFPWFLNPFTIYTLSQNADVEKEMPHL